MNKNTKMLLGVAILGSGGYLIWKSLKPKPTISFIGSCKNGLKPCPKNPRKCYDPKINYLVNPCSSNGFTGNLNPGPLVSKRQMSGGVMSKRKRNLTEVRTDLSRDSGWLRGDGYVTPISDPLTSGSFFDIKGSGWLRGK
jgi:hypothetical protein